MLFINFTCITLKFPLTLSYMGCRDDGCALLPVGVQWSAALLRYEPPKRIVWREDWRLCAELIVFGFRVQSGCISHSSGDAVVDMNALCINGSHPESRVVVIGILTRYRMEVSAFESQQEKGLFFCCPKRLDQLWGAPSLLYKKCWCSWHG